jgi:pimeloyl-ACP methyl ester carboxylesterase
MPTVTSADGTTIAHDVLGDGPAVILVDGALCHRTSGPMGPLGALLAKDLTVYRYDRRGRGESTDTAPWSAQREVEDLQALLAAAGGSAVVYAISSGVALALAAAAVTPGITGLVLYEPPYLGEQEDGERSARYTADLRSALNAGDRDHALTLFLSRVGTPAPMIEQLRGGPGWPMLIAVAPTLAYDDALLTGGRMPRDVAARVSVPALVVAGGASPVPLREAARRTAEALPHGRFRVLDGQTHDVAPEAVAPLVIDHVRALAT